jgi:hypothetical protein
VKGQRPAAVDRKRTTSTILVSLRHECCANSGRLALNSRGQENNPGKCAIAQLCMISAATMRSAQMMSNSWKIAQLLDLPFETLAPPALMLAAKISPNQIQLDAVPAGLLTPLMDSSGEVRNLWLQRYSKLSQNAPFCISYHYSEAFVNAFGYSFEAQLAAYKGVDCMGCPDCWVAEKMYSGTGSAHASTKQFVSALCSASSYNSAGSSTFTLLDAVRSDGDRVAVWSAFSALPTSTNELWLAGSFSTQALDLFDVGDAGCEQPPSLNAGGLTDQDVDMLSEMLLGGVT